MRCIIKGCMITCKHPQKSRCWRVHSMCKYHAYQFHPEIYSGSYRPMNSKFEEICRRIEYE